MNNATSDKHTPGPWTMQEADDRVFIYAGQASIATVHGERRDGVMNYIANAHLIAAAPETAAERDSLRDDLTILRHDFARLRAVNAELVAALERIDRINGSTGGAKSLVAEFKHIARIALAKAKGDA